MKNTVKVLLVATGLALATASHAATDAYKDYVCGVAGEFSAVVKEGHLVGMGYEPFMEITRNSETISSENMRNFYELVIVTAYAGDSFDSKEGLTIKEKAGMFGSMVRKACLDLGVY